MADKTKKVYYAETYSGIFEVPEEIANGTQSEIAAYLAETGAIERVEMADSHVVPLIGNGDPQYQIMDGKIDAMSDHEKKFYLWYLLRHYYKPKLIDDRFDYDTSSLEWRLISKIIDNVDEIDDLLVSEIF